MLGLDEIYELTNLDQTTHIASMQGIPDRRENESEGMSFCDRVSRNCIICLPKARNKLKAKLNSSSSTGSFSGDF